MLLSGGRDLCKSGWPFKNNVSGIDLTFQKDTLSRTESLFERLLVYPISVKMSEEYLTHVTVAIEYAAREVL